MINPDQLRTVARVLWRTQKRTLRILRKLAAHGFHLYHYSELPTEPPDPLVITEEVVVSGEFVGRLSISGPRSDPTAIRRIRRQFAEEYAILYGDERAED